MKKMVSLFSVLAAMLLMSALPAFSAGTGPYGAFGSTMDNYSRAADNAHVVLFGGTGPYGGFGPVVAHNNIPGMEKTPTALAWGTGPYGVLNSHGLVARDKSGKDECLLVAMNCPLREISK